MCAVLRWPTRHRTWPVGKKMRGEEENMTRVKNGEGDTEAGSEGGWRVAAQADSE